MGNLKRFCFYLLSFESGSLISDTWGTPTAFLAIFINLTGLALLLIDYYEKRIWDRKP